MMFNILSRLRGFSGKLKLPVRPFREVIELPDIHKSDLAFIAQGCTL